MPHLQNGFQSLVQLLRAAYQRPHLAEASLRCPKQRPVVTRQRSRRGRRPITIPGDQGEYAHGQIADLVGQVAVDAVLEGGVREVTIVAKWHLQSHVRSRSAKGLSQKTVWRDRSGAIRLRWAPRWILPWCCYVLLISLLPRLATILTYKRTRTVIPADCRG